LQDATAILMFYLGCAAGGVLFMWLFVSSGDGLCWLFLQVPVDLVIDHSVQVDVARSPNALHANMELEFGRNKERFAFLKWGATAFKNMLVVPPGSGIVHQVGSVAVLIGGSCSVMR
jgi:hypothetical protein